MNIAVLGSGTVGRTLARRFAVLGHQVRLGTRSPEVTAGREGWEAIPAVELHTFADAVAGADVVVNASNGQASLEVLASARLADLPGVVVWDISNPLDFSAGFPPTLSVSNTDSLGEQLQRAFPAARVVKGLNTLTAALMVAPSALPEATTVFVCGNDAAAKAVVSGLLRELGHTDVLDLGGIEAARGTEQWLPLWLRIMGALGSPMFNLRIVRS